MKFFWLSLILLPTITQYSIAQDNSKGDFQQLNIAAPILQADLIVEGEVRFINVDDLEHRRALNQVLAPKSLYGDLVGLDDARKPGGEKSPELGKSILFVDPEEDSMYSPVALPKKQNLLFLHRAHLNDDLLKKYNLTKSDVVYEMCDCLQGAITINTPFPTLESETLKKCYGITDLNLVPPITAELSAWKSLDTKPKQVEALLTLANAHQKEQLYIDNIQILLKNLGDKLTLENGVYITKPVPVPTAPNGVQVAISTQYIQKEEEAKEQTNKEPEAKEQTNKQ